LSGSLVPYYLDNEYSTHVALPDGSSVALARVPNSSKELLSGLNSLYELKDLKAFLDLVPAHLLWAVARRQRAKSVREFNKWVSKLEDTVRSPLGILQFIAGADLMWKFGVKPFLSDINNVMSVIGQLDSKLAALKALRFTQKGMFRDSKSIGYNAVSGNSPDTLGYYTNRVDIVKSTTGTWVYGVQKGLNPAMLPSINTMRIKLIRDQLGLYLDATDLWEAVPYSFVVDWFLPVQTFLEQFRAQPDPSWILTYGGWTSVKTETSTTVTETIEPLTTANCVVNGSSGTARFATARKVDYIRSKFTSVPFNPPTYIPSLRWPTVGQSVTGIELLIQRIKRTLK
jgi:hypothetical protein